MSFWSAIARAEVLKALAWSRKRNPVSTFDMPGPAEGFSPRGGWLVKSLARELDLNFTQAAGPVGNLGYESGGLKELQEVRPLVPRSRGGRGWAMWTGDRRDAFEGWCQGCRLDPDGSEANYGYLLVELRGPYKSTVEALRKCTTLDQAVFAFGEYFERPYGTTATHLPGFDGRMHYARLALWAAQNGAKPADTERDLYLTTPPMTGPDVTGLQRLLDAKVGPLDVDGVFGAATRAAVVGFQRSHGLTPDGIVGAATLAALKGA